MIIYRAGGLIRSIYDLVEGNQYVVCGIGGVLKKVYMENGANVFRFTATKEGVILFISGEALEGKIELGLVRKLVSANKPRQSTIKKYYKK